MPTAIPPINPAKMTSPNSAMCPSPVLFIPSNAKPGSFEEFLSKFSNAAATLFGSGWAWLVVDTDGKLNITQESNAGNPLRKGLKPLLTCDVWEHAYYLDYQNRRPDYIQAFWKIVDWSVVEKRFEKVR